MTRIRVATCLHYCNVTDAVVCGIYAFVVVSALLIGQVVCCIVPSGVFCTSVWGEAYKAMGSLCVIG